MNEVVEPKRVVITGASSGLGRALAVEYARQGATLALIARRGDALKELAASLPVRSHCYQVDVRDANALMAAGKDFVHRVGCPDIVIANAGVSAGTLTQHSEDARVFEEILATNVTGMMLTFQPFLEAMRSNKRGVLAGIASVAGFRGLPGASAYCASKSAAITYLESLRLELQDSGIKVVTVCPGYIDTPLTEVNTYRMPFMMEAQTAAPRIVDAISRAKRFYVLPWQMVIAGWFLRRLPRNLYDFLFALAPRKPRRTTS